MRDRVRLHRIAALVVGLAVTAIVGCGPSFGSLAGKVTYSGQPLKGGTVTLIPDGSSGTTFSATIGEDGTYKFDSVQSGKYKVCVETESLKPGAQQRGPVYNGKALSQGKGKVKNEPPPGAKLPEGYKMGTPSSGEEASKHYVQIPAAYGSPDSTTLSVEVKGGLGTQTYDIPLS